MQEKIPVGYFAGRGGRPSSSIFSISWEFSFRSGGVKTVLPVLQNSFLASHTRKRSDPVIKEKMIKLAVHRDLAHQIIPT
jgi:hypothetical protein